MLVFVYELLSIILTRNSQIHNCRRLRIAWILLESKQEAHEALNQHDRATKFWKLYRMQNFNDAVGFTAIKVAIPRYCAIREPF